MIQLNSILIGFIGMGIPAALSERQNDPQMTAERSWQRVSHHAGYQLCLTAADLTAANLHLQIRRPCGSNATDAQVVVALIDQQNRHTLTRAEWHPDGYRIDRALLFPTLQRIEIEVIVDGQLLTDYFQLKSSICNRETGHEYN